MTDDSDTPPATPPPGADPLIWLLARTVHQDHSADPNLFCLACKEWWPCPPREAAERGLRLAHHVRWTSWPVE